VGLGSERLPVLVEFNAGDGSKSKENLKWLCNRQLFPVTSVDVVCVDPPFNSNADILLDSDSLLPECYR
jgi:hypothetical protein